MPINVRTNSRAGAAWTPIRCQKEGPRRTIYMIQPEGSAKQEISSGLLVCRWLSDSTRPQLRRAVLHAESWRSYERSTATAGYPTDGRGRGRLRIRETWPVPSLNCRFFCFPLLKTCSLVFDDTLIHTNLSRTWGRYTLQQSME